MATTAGVLYLVTHVTSIAAVILNGPVLSTPEYVTSSGQDGRVLLGAWCEVVLAMAFVVAIAAVVKYSWFGGATRSRHGRAELLPRPRA